MTEKKNFVNLFKILGLIRAPSKHKRILKVLDLSFPYAAEIPESKLILTFHLFRNVPTQLLQQRPRRLRVDTRNWHHSDHTLKNRMHGCYVGDLCCAIFTFHAVKKLQCSTLDRALFPQVSRRLSLMSNKKIKYYADVILERPNVRWQSGYLLYVASEQSELLEGEQKVWCWIGSTEFKCITATKISLFKIMKTCNKPKLK